MSTPFPDDRPLSDVSDAEIAAVDFTPWDRNGACPVPTSEQFEVMKRVAPWLRIAFLYMSLNKQEFADAISEMPEDDLDSLDDVIRTTGQNCGSLAKMCEAFEARLVVAYAVLVERQNANGRLA